MKNTLLTLLAIPGGYAHWVFTVMVIVPGLVRMTTGRLWHVVFIALGWWMSS